MEESSISIASGNTIIRSLSKEEESLLQDLCERCQDYFELAQDSPARSNEAAEIFTMLPPGKNYADKHVLGIFNHVGNNLIGVIDIVRDFPEQNIWIIGLMMLDPAYRKRGLGKEIYESLSQFCRENKANEIEIGVLQGNTKGLNFWQKLGFVEIKRKDHVHGNKQHIVIVMRHSLK